jgi:putative Holliday junction resolvase
VAFVARLAAAEDVDEVVVGLPLTLTGAASAQAEAVMALVRELALVLPIPVTTVDERLSTVQATRQQPAGGRRARDGSIDSAAAAIVLQSLLDSLRVRG